MRAAVFHGGGDVRIEAVAAPGDPGPGEVLIATIAHIGDSNLPESLAVPAQIDLAGEMLGEVVPLERLVEDAIAPLAAGTAPGTMVVEVAA